MRWRSPRVGGPASARTLSGRPEALLARARIGRTLLSLVTADRRARLAAAADLVADAALVDAAMRGAVAPSAARLEPVERRRAVLVIIDAWRELGRDLAVAASGASGDGRGVRDLDQLEELLAWVDASTDRPCTRSSIASTASCWPSRATPTPS